MSFDPLCPFFVVIGGIEDMLMVGDIGTPRAMVLCIRSKFGRMRWRDGWYRRGVGLEDYVCDIVHSAPSHEGVI